MKRNAFSLLIAYLSVALTFCSLPFSTTYAASGPEVEDNHAEADFPESVTFYLSVSSQAVIDTIELEYGVTQITCGVASAQVRPDFEPATQVKVSWTWDFRKSNSPPPGARIWWRWHVRDKASNELEVEEQEIYFDDPRYDWQEIRSDELFLSTTPDQAVNESLWQAANEALERLESDIGARPERLVKIYNYPSAQDLRGAVVFTREWTGGLAFIPYDTILLGVNRSDLEWGERAMNHELAHLVVHQVTFNCLGDLPTWLDEGLAEYIEGDLRDYSREILDESLAKDDLISLQSLSSSFPTSDKRASLAYAQSRQIVSYLIEAYGREKMAELLQTFKEGTSYDKALQRVYGLDTQSLDNEWRASLGLPPHPIMATATPLSLPTLVPYGAGTPTAAIPAPTLTPSPPTVTSTTVPTSPLTATPTTRPTVTVLPSSTLTPAVSTLTQIGVLPLALIIGAIVIVGALVAALIRLQSLKRWIACWEQKRKEKP